MRYLSTTTRLGFMDRLRVLWHGTVEVNTYSDPPMPETDEINLALLGSTSVPCVPRVFPRLRKPKGGYAETAALVIACLFLAGCSCLPPLPTLLDAGVDNTPASGGKTWFRLGGSKEMPNE